MGSFTFDPKSLKLHDYALIFFVYMISSLMMVNPYFCTNFMTIYDYEDFRYTSKFMSRVIFDPKLIRIIMVEGLHQYYKYDYKDESYSMNMILRIWINLLDLPFHYNKLWIMTSMKYDFMTNKTNIYDMYSVGFDLASNKA